MKKKDIFLSHASEDKQEYVYPLAKVFDTLGISYWLDEAEIKWGSSVTQKINEGISTSRFVLVLLSESFINKKWTMAELVSALNQENSSGEVVVLPVLITSQEAIFGRLPLLRDKFYLTWQHGPENIGQQLLKLLNREYKADWIYSHPETYAGKVWIRIQPKPGYKTQVHEYTVNWGAWQYKSVLHFGDDTSVTLWHTKGNDGLSIPIYFHVIPECYVTFGTGEPADKSALDITEGWKRLD